MADPETQLVTHREGGKAAVVFLHGFMGSPEATWREFPRFLVEEPALAEWGVHSMAYSTTLAPDLRGVWSADASIVTLAERLRTAAKSRFDKAPLALVAHSMGGLVVQRALLDDDDFRRRVSHVVLFGTPSAGLARASRFALWKNQIAEMADDGEFITDLRRRWRERHSPKPSFAFVAVAGENDEFVPRLSSIDPFPEDQRGVVPGNHLEIVKPPDPAHESVALVRSLLTGQGAVWGQWASALMAVERGEFQTAIDAFLPNVDGLDQRSAVALALALDSVGRQADAMNVLKARSPAETDAMRTLAGRLKRRWITEGRREDGERARGLYHDALERSRAAGNARQEYYHAINVAFMTLGLDDDLPHARVTAREALEACERAPEHYWRLATEGEAHLVLGEDDEAVVRYGGALALRPAPREVDSIHLRAWRLSYHLLHRPRTAERIETLFRERPT